ncbi:hypothetical protein OSB04_un001613 [Centaurea solstitialis]|uniref:Uncharacterized protein n=1 Tax=Centaurea solstitialis TaxID=347529 RepID=A0AA38S3R9_9ASTR|nr:hypothetical protein OSB04_un001613 [Centaurea solstitialis]
MRPYKHGHQLFLEYDVRMYGTGVPRGELQNWTFTEADLDRVHLEDLLTIIKYLQGPILRPEHYRDGTEILKKYVRHAISLARVTDYQLAIESRQPKVNLLRPNLLVPGIDAYTPYMPTRIPEHGVLYITQKKKERRLLADQVPSRRIIDGKGKLLEAMRLIEKKLKERMMYRRAEAAMQMRARIIGEWEEYLQMSKWEPALEGQQLWYPKGLGFELQAYSDADYGGCNMDRKSTSGHIQLLGNKLVSWASKKQQCVSTSTAESEYVAAASCCSQVLWMQTQLRDYGFVYKKIPIYCDSKSAIAISANPVQHSKTKHIDIRYHFLKDNVEKENIELYFVNTEYQLAIYLPRL